MLGNVVPAAVVGAVTSSAFIHEWVLGHAAERPDSPALAMRSTSVSYAELAQRVLILADHLAAQGVGAGDRLLLALPNLPATVVAALAVNLLGAVSVEVSRTWNSEIIADIAMRSRVKQAFVWARDAPAWTAPTAARALEHVWVVGGRTPNDPRSDVDISWISEDGSVDQDLPSVPRTRPSVIVDDSPAVILYTSGSTGRPQGVVQTFRNIHANTRSIVDYLGLTADDRALLTLPICYCYGRSVIQTHLYVGGSIYMENSFAFPRKVMETLGREGCTGFAGVPLTFEILRRQVDVTSIAMPSLRYVTQAGGAMPLDTTAWVREQFRPARLFLMYGQTEATARLSYLPPDRASDKEGSIGIPIPGVELRVVDSDGAELPDGTVGELIARGANVTLGYLDEPDATARILRDGWLWTGDLAVRDADGFFHHRGRAKEILKIGGRRVSPIEIEEVLAGHPDITEAAVRGVPDALMGEVPVAFVVFRDAQRPADGALRAFCGERLPAYMVPVRFVPLAALPRNEAGKLLRADLAEPQPTV